MNAHNRYFMTLLNAAIRGERAEAPEHFTAEDWNRVFHMAQTHHVLPLIYEAIYHLPELQDGAYAALKRQVRQQIVLQAMKTYDFLALNAHLRSSGIKPLVMKGIVCRQLYPCPDTRASGDEDLLIPAEQFSCFHDAMMSFDMVAEGSETDPDTACEIPYRKNNSSLYIEAHKYLFPPESAAYGDLNRFFDGVFERAVEENIQGEPVLTMEPTDHLFYLICHSLKHFLHSGFGVRQVCDIILYAERCGAQINWEQILENCRQIRAEKFAASVFRIGTVYLRFDAAAAHFPDIWQKIRVNEGPMLEDLLDAGIYGGAERSRQHSSTITLTAVADQKRGTKGFGGVMASLFPPVDSMKKRYPYLDRHPVLLPVAWASRVLQYGKEIRNNNHNSAVDSIRIGKQRIALMKEYGILDD